MRGPPGSPPQLLRSPSRGRRLSFLKPFTVPEAPPSGWGLSPPSRGRQEDSPIIESKEQVVSSRQWDCLDGLPKDVVRDE
jgi:hypothetical protein